MSFHTQLLVHIIQQATFNSADRLLVIVISVLGCQLLTTRNFIFHEDSFQMDLNVFFPTGLSSFCSPVPSYNTIVEVDN